MCHQITALQSILTQANASVVNELGKNKTDSIIVNCNNKKLLYIVWKSYISMQLFTTYHSWSAHLNDIFWYTWN